MNAVQTANNGDAAPQLVTDQNLNHWTIQDNFFTHNDTFTNGVNNLSLTSSGGWEKFYHAYTVTPGKTYTITLTYDSSNYSPGYYSSLGGIVPLQVLTTSPTGSDNVGSQIASLLVNPNQTNWTETVTFTPIVSTIYLYFNFGLALDGQTIGVTIRNISLQ